MGINKIYLDFIKLKTIDRYIIKKYLGTFFFSIALIISISVVFDISEKIDDFLENNAPISAIAFDYYLNFIPFFANLFTPLFSFISVIFFTSKLATNTEVIAILAGGVSFNRLLRPYMLSSILIGVMSFLLSGYIIPPANKVRLAFEDQYISKFKNEVVRHIQLEVESGTILYIERFELESKKGNNCSLERFEGKRLMSRLTARTIKWDSAYTWKLEDYLIRDFDGLKENLIKGDVMDTVINIDPREFFITRQQAAEMTNSELVTYINRQKERGLGNVAAFQDELYKRVAMPFSAIILMIIGVSLSSRKIKGGMGANIGFGIALSAVYILFSTVSSTFATSGSLPPLLAVWLPNILFMMIAGYLYVKAPR